MPNELLREIISNHHQGQKKLAILIDPDKSDAARLATLSNISDKGGVDYFLVGGSFLKSENTRETVLMLKSMTDIPVILFPGSPSQICEEADAILLLSLISGRNPDLLIGRHVEAAPVLHASGLEILPTGYILVDGGKPTSVTYMSQTIPIPFDKPELAAFTALAGVQLGLSIIYMDAGSGALKPVSPESIKAVSNLTGAPVFVGGGIRSLAQLHEAWRAGADVAVVGNLLEEHPEYLNEIIAFKKEWSMMR